jgi:hypothetical protein
MSILKNYLNPQERVIDRIATIKYRETIFDCAITDHRILLHRRDKLEYKDIDYKLINKFSLEKEWYGEFFLGSVIATIMGLIWFISAIGYHYIEIVDPALIPPVMVIKALLYPGLVLACLGVAGLYFYYSRMKLHIQISTPEENLHLFAKEDRLDELRTIYEGIKTGEIPFSKGIFSDISDKQRLSEEPIVAFNNIQVKLTFKDENIRKKTIKLNCSVKLSENFMHLTSSRLTALKKGPTFGAILGKRDLPVVNEDNLSRIFDIAQELQINWIFLTDFNFTLSKMALQNNHFLTGLVGSDTILLRGESLQGQFAVELTKVRLFTNARAKEIIEIDKFFKIHLKNG